MKKINFNNINEKIYHEKLDNGFNIYIIPSDFTNEIYATLTIKYGSIHTSFNNINVPNGIAHFIEHIKFNESSNKTAHEYFQKLGSYVNAYTTFDHTSYEINFLNNIDKNINHLLKFVLNPYFTNKIINKEKPIIIEEAKMTLTDPYSKGYFYLLNNSLHNDNHKNIITGTQKEIESITLNDIKNVFENFYVPSNMFLTVTGNVDVNKVIDIVKDYFNINRYNKKKIPKIKKINELPSTKKEFDILKENVESNRFLVNYKIKCSNTYEEIMKLKILLSLNFSLSSDFREKIEKCKLATGFTYSLQKVENYQILTFEYSSQSDKLLSILDKKMNNLVIDKNSFERKKKTLLSSTITVFDNHEQTNSMIRKRIIYYDDIIKDFYNITDHISYEDILLLKNNLTFSKSILKIEPLKK